MRLALAAAVISTLIPAGPLAQTASQATPPPSPAPKADAGPTAPPKAEPAPKAGSGANAQPIPKAAAPSQGGGEAAARPPAAASELARALLSREQWNKVLDTYAGSLTGQISQALQASGEKVPDDLRAQLRGELDRAIPYQQTVDAQAAQLAKALSPDELRKTASFYGSPLGKKVLEKLPEVQTAVAQQLQAKLATTVPEIINRLAPKAMAGSPHGGPGGPGPGGPHGAGPPGGGGGDAAKPPPAQGRRPPDGGTTR